MPSIIDPNKPFDGIPASKADLRANLAAAKQELEHGGFFKQAGVGAIERTVHGKLREFDVSVMDFGAVGNALADDTAAIQKAIDHIGTTKKVGHSRILFRGQVKYTPASLDWSPIQTEFGGSVTIYVDGVLHPQGGPVLIDPNMHLVGIGGTAGVQFQLGPCCAIGAAPGQIGLWMRSHGNKSIRNVTVYGSTEPAILLTGTDNSQEATLGSLYWLENVSAISGVNSANADALRIEHCFWVWVKNFRFLSNGANAGWSINVVDDDPTAIAGSGIHHYDDGVIAGRGIRIRAGVPSSTGTSGNMKFRNILMESARTAMFTLDTVSPVDSVTIEHCEMADTIITPTTMINTVNTPADQIVIRDTGNILCTGLVPRNLMIENKPKGFMNTGTYQLTDDGTYPRRGTVYLHGEVDGRDAFRNAEMLPNMLPVQNFGALQDATAWTAVTSHFSATAGQLAPDGSSTAYLIEYVSGGSGRQNARAYDNGSTPMTDGDFLIAGCWFKSAVAGQRMYVNNLSRLDLPVNPPLIDGSTGADLGHNERCAYGDVGWVLSVDWWKWTGANAGWLIWSFIVDQAGYSYYVWKPFLLRVDGSLHTERDVARIAARLSVVDQNAKTGVLTMLPHHTFRTGIGVSGSRPSASAVGQGAQWFDATLNKPVWSDGTTWRDASGNVV